MTGTHAASMASAPARRHRPGPRAGGLLRTGTAWGAILGVLLVGVPGALRQDPAVLGVGTITASVLPAILWGAFVGLCVGGAVRGWISRDSISLPRNRPSTLLVAVAVGYLLSPQIHVQSGGERSSLMVQQLVGLAALCYPIVLGWVVLARAEREAASTRPYTLTGSPLLDSSPDR